MVAVSADDYAWFTEQCAELADAFCLTLVRGRQPGEVIDLLGGTDPATVAGVHRLPEAARARGGRLIAVTEIDGWALIVEPAGDRVAGDRVSRRLSRGTVLVSHRYHDTADPLFVWARDGEVLLEFDPSDAGDRRGTDPDGLIEVLERLGFDARDGRNEDSAYDARHRERTLALAEHLTGVRITLEALEAATFSCATLPDPDGAGQTDSDRAQAHRSAARPAASPTKWDEEYDADDEDDDDSDDDTEEGDDEEREWPRLKAVARRIFG